MYAGCIAMTSLFREKREWFRYFFFPTLMKAIGSYVTQVTRTLTRHPTPDTGHPTPDTQHPAP